jgi:hypothetical protein
VSNHRRAYPHLSTKQPSGNGLLSERWTTAKTLASRISMHLHNTPGREQ